MRRWPVIFALCLYAGASPLRAEEFFPTRNENPLLRAFYLPLPSDSRQRDPDGLAAVFSVSNTLNVERRRTESLFVDGESDTLRLSYQASLLDSWRYRVTLPITHDSGGALDTAIADWHRGFDFQPGNRPFYPINVLRYSYSGQGNIDLKHSQTSVGSVSAEVGWYAVDDDARTVSIWCGTQAPSGRVSKLTGDGAWDAALWAHWAARRTSWQFAAELGVARPFGDKLFGGSAQRASLFGRSSLTRTLNARWSIRAQLEAQTRRVTDSELRFLGPSVVFSTGLVYRSANHWRIEMGLSEDAAVNTAPDIGFFLGLQRAK